MKNSIFKLMEKASNDVLDPKLQAYAEANSLTIGDGENETPKQEIATRLAAAEEFLYAQFTGTNYAGEEVKDLPSLQIREALNTSDISIVFPRVISDILQEPKEPNLFLTNAVADTIALAPNTPLLIEFPTVDALQAYEMSEGQEYTTQTFSVAQHMTSIRIKKVGVAAAINEEVLIHSMWPLLQMHLRMMSAAIDRRIESILFQAMTGRAQTVFDNENSDTTFQTTGKYLTGTGSALNNGSFSYNDLVKMCGVMLGNRYEPTHFLAHPLAWPIFAQDPIMKAQFYQGGQLGNGIWTRMPAYDQSANFPFGIAYVPYYALPYHEQDTLTGVLSSLGASLTSDLYLIDSRNSLFMATRGGTEMDQMDNWFKDAKMMKARKYVGVSAKAGGKGMLKAANVRIVTNEEPLFTIRTLAS
jgi:hypothetical protein